MAYKFYLFFPFFSLNDLSYKNIKEALKILGLKPAYHLKLPEYNVKTKQAVPVGYLYVAKLEHLGAEKIHSRSTGPMVGKILQPTSGKIFFDQNNIIDYSIDELVIHRRDTVGLIYQDYNLLHDFKVKENIALPMIIAGKKKDEINKRIHYLSSKLGVERYINTFPHRLSGGEQQRVGIAVALANNPDVILADEPTGNLDRTNSDIVFDLLVDICKKEHKTLIIATHDINLQKKLPKLISLETGD